MNWKPKKIIDITQQLPSFKLLKKAVWKLYQKDIIRNPYEVLKDQHGTYGYRYGHFILLAKKEVYGNIVSFHKKAVLKAMEFNIPILLWLDSNKEFYLFDPEEVYNNSERNYKGSTEMLNCSIKLGKRWTL